MPGIREARSRAVAEELRFFLRLGLFAALIATVYWFISYEVAGTILLAGLVFSSGLFVATVGHSIRSSMDDVTPDGGVTKKVGGAVKRLVGFEEDSEPASSAPLALAEEPVAHTSAWPILTAVSALLIGLGLLWGAWFWGPGITLTALSAWGWSSQIRK